MLPLPFPASVWKASESIRAAFRSTIPPAGTADVGPDPRHYAPGNRRYWLQPQNALENLRDLAAKSRRFAENSMECCVHLGQRKDPVMNASPKTSPIDPLLHPKEAAKILNVSLSWLAKARLSGTGPRFVKIGRSVRYLAFEPSRFHQGADARLDQRILIADENCRGREDPLMEPRASQILGNERPSACIGIPWNDLR